MAAALVGVPVEEVSTEDMQPQVVAGVQIPSPETQQQALQGTGCAGLLGFLVCILIYGNAAEGGGAYCSEDLSGYLFVAAYTYLALCVSPVIFGILISCCPAVKNQLITLHGLAQLGGGLFGIAWFILGNMRLYSTEPCAAAGAGCCKPELYHAVHGWFVFMYVLLSLVACVCCCGCCALWGSLAAAAAAAGANEKTPLSGSVP